MHLSYDAADGRHVASVNYKMADKDNMDYDHVKIEFLEDVASYSL